MANGKMQMLIIPTNKTYANHFRSLLFLHIRLQLKIHKELLILTRTFSYQRQKV
jgi:hypothetical protein